VANVPLLYWPEGQYPLSFAHAYLSVAKVRYWHCAASSGKLKFEMRDGKPDTAWQQLMPHDGQYSATEGCRLYACGISRYPQGYARKRREMLENQYNPYTNREKVMHRIFAIAGLDLLQLSDDPAAVVVWRGCACASE
jgi:hypothetical protein